MTRPIAPTQQQLSFWPEAQALNVEARVVLLLKGHANPIGRFPGAPPGLDEILDELAKNRTCWLAPDDRKGERVGPSTEHVKMKLLAGRLLVHVTCSDNEDGYPRLFLQKTGGIEFATNRLRAALLGSGRLLHHRGIRCLSGKELNDLETVGDHDGSGSFWNGGVVAGRLRDALNSTPGSKPIEPLQPALSEAERGVLTTLRDYVDAQFEVEQAAARALPAFIYTALRAEARTHVYRQYLRVQLDLESAKRLSQERIMRVALELDEGESIPLQIEGEVSADGSIVMSLGRQMDIASLPASGRMTRQANATTRNVSNKALDALGAGSHPWLPAVAAGTYVAPPLSVQPLEVVRTLNPSQAHAVAAGNQTPDYVLVLGPPGTGKTTVIADWVEHFVLELGQRVLVTTQANKAIDNVLERLAKRGGIECVRLASEGKVMASVQDLLIEVKAPAMQRKLIEHGGVAIEQLRQVHDWLVALRPAVADYAQARSNAHGLVRELNGLASQLSTRTQARERVARDLRHARAAEAVHTLAIDQLLAASRARPQTVWSWPWFWATALFIWIKLRFARSRLASVAAQLSVYELEFARADVQITELRAASDIANEQLALENARRDALIPARPELAVQVSIDPELLPIEPSAAKRAVIEEIARIERLQATVSAFRHTMENERQESLLPLLFSLVDVVGATCIGIASRPQFKDAAFDVVIIDEAGQIQLHTLAVPLSRAPKAILVGDHKQLPPVVEDPIKAELTARNTPQNFLHTSWFEKLWGEAPETRKVALDTQFRCPAVISEYISRAFYGSKYYAGKGMADKRPLLAEAESCLLFIDTSQHRDRGEVERRGERNEILDNPLETRLVVSVLERAYAQHPRLIDDSEGVGVIVPYKNHVARIQTVLRERIRRGEFPAPSCPAADLVATVDSFQGQERHLIVFTMSRANARGTIGFLKDARRLNVAMTRAKQQLVLIADAETLTLDNGREEDRDFKDKMRSLLTYVREEAHLMRAADWLRQTESSH